MAGKTTAKGKSQGKPQKGKMSYEDPEEMLNAHMLRGKKKPTSKPRK